MAASDMASPNLYNRKFLKGSDESRFLLWYSDGRVIVLYKQHEGMDTSCQLLAVV